MTAAASDEEVVLENLAARRHRINEAIDEELPVEEPARLYEASRYLLEAGGKRLRPAIVLLVAEALTGEIGDDAAYRRMPTCEGGEPIDVMRAALSIEIVQSFTLIHDDIMDDDDLRRGVPAVHEEFDLETAILAGDTLYSKAFETLLETGAPADHSIRALRILAATCTRICEGQALDLAFESDDDVRVPAYRDMIERKTAVLFRAAAAIPAVLLGADEETVEALGAYGRSVGEAFQIHDDVLDLTVPSDTLGKRRGSDLIEGKRTLITIHAARNGVDVDGLLPPDPDEAAIEAAVAEIEAAGSISFARAAARELVDDGVDQLAVLPANEATDQLGKLANYLIERGY